MTCLKPLPTRYNGITYRSRLEARWAIVWHGLGLRAIYEPDGFDIDGEWYLPDFRIGDKFIEIKPVVPELHLYERFARVVGHSIFAVCGQPEQERFDVANRMVGQRCVYRVVSFVRIVEVSRM